MMKFYVINDIFLIVENQTFVNLQTTDNILYSCGSNLRLILSNLWYDMENPFP